MEKVIHTPKDLGELAEKTRTELGLRQSDIHSHSKLTTRFIGEVEHGKETAQIGKVMKMLESIGLELVIRPQTSETMVNPHNLGLSRGRFWSSGDQLPVMRVIARVLDDPTEPDIVKLKQHFGMGLILSTWQQLKERGEVSPSVIPITQKILKKLASLS